METENNCNFSKSTRHNIELNLRILMTISQYHTIFHLKIPMHDRENERKLNPEGMNRMTEGQKWVTLYASAISWRGHKETKDKNPVTNQYTLFDSIL